mmetsp:Transcript_39382/g.92585  ORF Transcript_39382/g.92585 Transcript_39382/m.92585 type:complete len:270 (-) Transcript_39382:522-1331(-)
MSHTVAVMCNELQHSKRLCTGVLLGVEIPRQLGLAVHDVTAAEPRGVHVLVPERLVLDHEEMVLCVLVVPRERLGNPVVEVEVVVVVHVRLDALQVHEHVVKLLEQEETHGHALAPRDGVAVRHRLAHKLEVLLCQLDELSVLVSLPDRRNHNPLENVLVWGGGLQVLDERVGLVELVLAEVVDDKVEPRLRNDIHQPRQHLKAVLPSSEDTEVVFEQRVVELGQREPLLLCEGVEFSLACLAVVQPEVIAGLQVDCDRAIRMLLQIYL